MENQYILLWLEAPLQSWGFDSKFGRRDTLKFPTRSGIVGLLCCALGATGDQKELLEELAHYGQTVISYNRTKAKDGVLFKVDREPLLRDFHMVGSGFDDSDPWATLLIPKTNDGKKAVGGGSKMTYRYYLQDAKFAIILELPSSRIPEIAAALQNPVYDLYLGRKNCVPTDFIFRGIFTSESAALEQAKSVALEKEVIEDFRVLEGEREGEFMTLNDIPLQFGEVKKYRDRRVTIVVC